jgi:hypothetical protein
MQENSNPGSDADERNKNNNPTQHKVVWRIVIAGIIGVVVILFVSLFWPNMAERTKFFTTNALSVLLLDVIIVQAYIYGRQWEAMREQRNAMDNQLGVMKAQQEAADKQLVWSGLQTWMMLYQWQSMRTSEQTLSRQADAFEAQVDVMSGQLEAMRRQQDQNERAIQAAQDNTAITREAFYVGEAPYFGTSNIVFRWARGPARNARGEEIATRIPELIITFMNGGKTPAWHFSAIPHLELGESRQVEIKWITLNVIHDNECPDAESTFYPSGTERRIKYQGRGEFSSSEIEAINTRTQTLFLIIDIGYTDMRDDRKTRWFLRCFNPITRGFGDCGGRQD